MEPDTAGDRPPDPTADRADPPAEPPPLRGAEVSLAPIGPKHYDALYRLELSPELGGRWRHKGATPSFDVFVESLWRGVLAQFLIVDNDDGDAVGFVTAYNANFRNQHAHVAVAKFHRQDRSLRALFGAGLFLNYLFENWNFRKLYAESAAYNYSAFASGAGRFFEEEGRLVGHEYYQGRWWDLVTLALYREMWERWKPFVLRYAVGGGRVRQRPGEFRPTRDWPMSSQIQEQLR